MSFSCDIATGDRAVWDRYESCIRRLLALVDADLPAVNSHAFVRLDCSRDWSLGDPALFEGNSAVDVDICTFANTAQ